MSATNERERAVRTAAAHGVTVGDVWEWTEPGGRTRTMLVQRYTWGPPVRVWGVHPETGRKLQALLSTLVRGTYGARRVRHIEGYTWQPVHG